MDFQDENITHYRSKQASQVAASNSIELGLQSPKGTQHWLTRKNIPPWFHLVSGLFKKNFSNENGRGVIMGGTTPTLLKLVFFQTL